jgi:hypothetical protein
MKTNAKTAAANFGYMQMELVIVRAVAVFGGRIPPTLERSPPATETISCTVLEDICDKPTRIQSYYAVARLHGA